MAVVNVNLEPHSLRQVTRHRVYLRSRWAEEWEEVSWLFAEEVNWCLAPGLGTARLMWRYGRGMRQGELAPGIVERLADAKRQFIKIEIDTLPVTTAEIAAGEADPLRWFGTVQLDGVARRWLFDRGNGVISEGGVQPLVAIDLAHALYRHPIRGATWRDSSGTAQRAERAYIFNKPNAVGAPEGNRSTDKGDRSYLFSSKEDGADQLWTSRRIAEYLCAVEVPTGPSGLVQFAVVLDPDTEEVLPDWDQPVIDPTGNQSMGDLLNLLMPRSRMLSWQLTVTTTEDGFDAVFLTPVSLLGDDVPTDLGTLKKNWRQVALQTTNTSDPSPDVAWTLKESDIPVIDQARVRGARRTTTCTISNDDGTVLKGWPSTLETEYEAGFSGAATYSGLGVDGKQTANSEVRESDRLFPVFRRYTLPTSWNQKVKDGLAGGSEKAVFPKIDGNIEQVKLVNPRELELAPTLPIVEGFDYRSIGSFTLRTAPTKVSDGPHNRLPALVLFKTPDWSGPGSAPYVQIDKLAAAAAVEQVSVKRDRVWSARVEIANGDRAVLLHVQGKPQHVLAFTDFTRLPVDEYQGTWDWRSAFFTVCLLDDRHAEGVYPDDSSADDDVADTKRELLVYAGDAYKLDYMVPETVIGLDNATRQPVRCTAGGWINDDRKVLNSRAQQIFEYFRQTRRSLTLETPIVNSSIKLGDYIVNVGRATHNREVGTVVSEITFTIDGNARPAPPSLRYTTAFAELEAAELLNRRPDTKELKGKAAALVGARGTS